MSTAPNAAITKRFGEQPNPITFVTGLEIARILIDKGVHLETARSAIAGVVERFNGQRPMTSLAYFREAIERAHASRVQRGLNAADPTVPEVRGGPPSRIEPGNTSMHLPGVDGTAERNAREHAERLEYDAARQAATHAWSMAEENTAEYEQITADVNAAYAGMLDHETGKRARDAMVILTCAKRCGFPASFEAWRANREAAKGNHRRPRLFRDALLVAIKEADAEGVEALYHVAKALVAEAKAGNVLAIKEIGDRLDGRVPQALPELGADHEEPVIDEERVMRALALMIEEQKLRDRTIEHHPKPDGG
jgi:hypothetical protein